MNYYYQFVPKTDLYLPEKWLCCGGVRDYGTKDEIEKSINFYLKYFSKHDGRGGNFAIDEKRMVIITDNFYGGVADRIELTEIAKHPNWQIVRNEPLLTGYAYMKTPAITDKCIIRKYNP